MHDRPHTHRCANCRAKFECDGNLENNHDGWPEVVCDAFHKLLFDLCESCIELRKADDLAAEAEA